MTQGQHTHTHTHTHSLSLHIYIIMLCGFRRPMSSPSDTTSIRPPHPHLSPLCSVCVCLWCIREETAAARPMAQHSSQPKTRVPLSKRPSTTQETLQSHRGMPSPRRGPRPTKLCRMIKLGPARTRKESAQSLHRRRIGSAHGLPRRIESARRRQAQATEKE